MVFEIPKNFVMPALVVDMDPDGSKGLRRRYLVINLAEGVDLHDAKDMVADQHMADQLDADEFLEMSQEDKRELFWNVTEWNTQVVELA